MSRYIAATAASTRTALTVLAAVTLLLLQSEMASYRCRPRLIVVMVQTSCQGGSN